MNFYNNCASALQLVHQKKGNFKTILFDFLTQKKFSKSEFQKSFSIIIKVNTMNQVLEDLISLLKQKNPGFKVQNEPLLKILLFELLFGVNKKIQGGGQLKRFLVENEPILKKKVEEMKEKNLLPDLSSSNTAGTVTLRRNIYLRIVKKRTTLESIKEKVADESDKMTIEKDELIPDLIKMSYTAYQSLRASEDYKQSSEYVVQSKSSCFPAYFLCQHLLNKGASLKEKTDIIDACSAPGNKTMQLADYLSDGRVIALERDERRFDILSKRTSSYGFENIFCICNSFLHLDPKHKKFNHVRYILVDPTCSGSGMLNNLENKEREQYPREKFEEFCDKEFQNLGADQQRKVEELGNSQLELLNHAAQFPNVQKISFSTCSIYRKENEEVVERFLAQNKSFKLVDLSKLWRTTGFSTHYKDGYKCLRADPINDEMDGFFVALFQKK